MARCDRCKKKAVTFIRYSGAHLCKVHFIEFLERRVKKDLRKQVRFEQGETLAVAVSGGKDSTVALYLLNKILKKRKDITIKAITVDEGIEGYRPGSIPIAEKISKELGIEWTMLSFKETLGVTMDQISKVEIEITPCAYCGVFRRKCLNIMAKQVRATKLITGLNLDDTAQGILMNFVRGDVAKMARMGPHKKVQPGLVPRIQPLRLIPEKEVYLYAMLMEIEIHEEECPYSEWALRGTYRNIINELETKTPGTRHAIIQSYDMISEATMDKFPPIDLINCERCGEPSSNTVCKACELVEGLKF